MRGRIIQAFEKAGTALCLIQQSSGYLQLVYKRKDYKTRSLGIFETLEDASAEFRVQAGNLSMLGRVDGDL